MVGNYLICVTMSTPHTMHNNSPVCSEYVRPCENCRNLNPVTSESIGGVVICWLCGYLNDFKDRQWTDGVDVLLLQVARAGGCSKAYCQQKYQQLIHLDQLIYLAGIDGGLAGNGYDDNIRVYQQTVRDLARLNQQYRLPQWRYQQRSKQDECLSPVLQRLSAVDCRRKEHDDSWEEITRLLDALWPPLSTDNGISAMLSQLLANIPEIRRDKTKIFETITMYQSIAVNDSLLLQFVANKLRQEWREYENRWFKSHRPLLDRINRHLLRSLVSSDRSDALARIKIGLLQSIYRFVSRELFCSE